MALKILKKNPGMSNREIGCLVKCSHNTVKTARSKKELPLYMRPQKINQILSNYFAYINELWLKKLLKGSRIFQERKSKGYTGGKIARY